MKNISNNDSFREMLMTADEYQLTCTAVSYVPFHLQQQSLISNEAFFYEWLMANYEEFNFSETEDPVLMQSEMTLFMSLQSREEKLMIYRDFMTSYGVIEDLLCLNLEERKELLMELGLVG